MNYFYNQIESRLNSKFNFHLPILRKLHSIEEQNNWFLASDKLNLSNYLSSKLFTDKINYINSPFNFGQVLQSGFVDTNSFLTSYLNYLSFNNLIVNSRFNYTSLDLNSGNIFYSGIKSKYIVFAEGFGLHSNPFFNYLPLDGTKGEVLVVKIPNFNLKYVLTSNIFIIPLGNNLYKVGATYEWNDKTAIPTKEGKNELISKLKELVATDFEIVSHLAGVRPTVRDRKPLLGMHPENNNMFVLNGMGTRGVMLAPVMAKNLFDYIEFGIPLDKVIDIKRYEKLYQF